MWEFIYNGEGVKIYLKAFKVEVYKYLNFSKRLHVKWNNKNEREAISFQSGTEFLHYQLVYIKNVMSMFKQQYILIKILTV